jgi:hypothetical protein
MEYGEIAGNTKINATIYHCFECIDKEEARKFVRKFKEQPHDNIQVMHTFRELILGAFLASNGFRVKGEYGLDGRMPDWCVVNETLQPLCIVELTNFHPDAETSEDIVRQMREKGLWCNFMKPNTDRLYQVIWKKADTYLALAEKYQLAYVIAVFGGFTADVEHEELDECLFGEEHGLFELYPGVSGVLFFKEFAGQYQFSYMANPCALRSISFPGGWFGIPRSYPFLRS